MRRKLLIIFTTLCLISVLVSAYVIFSIEKATYSIDNLITLHKIADMREKMLHQIEIVQDDLHLKQTRYARDLAQLVSHVSNMNEIIDACFGCHHSDDVDSRLSSLREGAEIYKRALSRVYTIRANEQRLIREEDSAFLIGEELIEEVEEMLVFTNQNLETKTQGIMRSVNRSKDLLLIFTIFAPIVIISMVFWFYVNFTKPVSSLLRATSRLKEGDLDYRVEKLDDEFGELAQSFNEMSSSLKEIMQTMMWAEHLVLMGEMASRLAHEIKNPITGIKLAVEVIRDEVHLNEEHRDLIMKTIDQIHNIERLMKGLLNFAKPPVPRLEKEDINRIIETAFATVEIMIRKRSDEEGGAGIHLVKDLDENLPAVMTDASHVQQVLLNLMLNAVDAMGREGTLTVKSSMSPEGDFLQVDVSDTGAGIDPALGEKIFQPFFSTKVKGTGLGLATVRRLVDINQGEIYFRSEVGAGSRFTVRFPVDPEKESTGP